MIQFLVICLLVSVAINLVTLTMLYMMRGQRVTDTPLKTLPPKKLDINDSVVTHDDKLAIDVPDAPLDGSDADDLNWLNERANTLNPDE